VWSVNFQVIKIVKKIVARSSYGECADTAKGDEGDSENEMNGGIGLV
jgi:hypothetical protein